MLNAGFWNPPIVNPIDAYLLGLANTIQGLTSELLTPTN
jgi:hypothetical protein